MTKELTIADIDFGKTDAKNELLIDKALNRNRFKNSFFVPDGLNLDDFHLGRYAFVVGLKGAGKTALLRFLDMDAREKGYATSFMLFKTEVSEVERQKFSKASGFTLVEEDKSGFEFQQDFENIWYWLFHLQIVKMILSNDPDFTSSASMRNYVDSVRSISPVDRESFIWRLFPSLKSGKMAMSLNAKYIEMLGEGEFQRTGNQKANVNFNDIVGLSNKLLSEMDPGKKRYIIYVDELELYYANVDSFARDCRLVRDLIWVVSRLNNIFITSDLPIRIVCAVRSEVLSSVSSLGKEIIKETSDFGFNLLWHQKGADASQPLLRVIMRKIEAAEKEFLGDVKVGSIWDSYFPSEINRVDARVYLLNQTWYRPRDVVRLLNMAKGQAGSRAKFTQDDFDRSRKEYGIESWIELTEELQAVYSQSEISALKSVLTGFQRRFSFEEFCSRLESRSGKSRPLAELLSRRSCEEVLQDLYRVGVLGNENPLKVRGRVTIKYRWAHRGDQEALLDQKIGVHRALWTVLALSESID